ncbi:hypothetical protein CBR_g41408 [Chara braunii]|uniref:Large ribosomal subunit protein uL18 C-terminal eukaryotes domain-containing protein n=1 Tax=Chara braunii TaxID=69332 RepID=A0A388LW18_CHABU|nr:hypothetical protein CBR_g41408 [Chara braunii]|eukprot:GBG86412.1 hypothetical protein CBR_g41408 [Chara braunii]
MAFQKVTKTRAYFRRYQVKYRRRRQGKTDYHSRIRLVCQDKNKYNTPKYRLAVRFTNKDCTCQVIYATIAGDIVVAAAYSHELPRYGLKVGLTNYAAAYCTGLLLARRLLNKYEMDEMYPGNNDGNVGEDFNVSAEDERRPFRALLDIGLVRTTTGNRCFGALKGALDGGLDIPHSEKRFAGYNKEDKSLDAEKHRRYIFGQHVAEYMKNLREEQPEKYAAHFSHYIKEGIEPEKMEAMYKSVHDAIRADPAAKLTVKKKPAKITTWKPRKLTHAEKKARLVERLKALQQDDEDDEEEEEDEE